MAMSKADSRFGEAVISRLLGPNASELSCERCFEELDRYVELELAGENADARVAGMRAHLEGCPACAEDYESLRELVVASDPTGAASA